jgi:hypothetical protein
LGNWGLLERQKKTSKYATAEKFEKEREEEERREKRRENPEKWLY